MNMNRTLYDEDHDLFARSARRFVTENVLPFYSKWEADGIIPKDVYIAAGQIGMLGMEIPIEYGGGGNLDFRYSAILSEVASYAGVSAFCSAIATENDICIPYLLNYGDDDLKRRCLSAVASGEMMTAIAMTEPGTGSDLAGITTRAERVNGGYLLTGAKTFITNGINSDIVIVVARTGNSDRHSNLSLLVVEDGTPGFRRGRNLAKIGLHAQDTAELFFDGVEVPIDNLLGEEGAGFGYLMANLPRERLSIAIASVAAAKGVLDQTIDYVKERRAFGRAIVDFQNTRFELAQCYAEINVAQAYVDRCIEALSVEELDSSDAAVAKWWCTDVQSRVVDRCLQLHGGYGYMEEYPVARAYVDARVTRIYGGTNEIMKEVVSRKMGLR
jgi:alkylation response protein AidB-like acyl-CoA dehydrogenase